MSLSRSLSLVAGFLLLPAMAYAQTATPVSTEPTSQYGLLEGTITNSNGDPITQNPGLNTGKHIKLVRQGGGSLDITSDIQMNGFYSAANLRPGIYDIVVDKGYMGAVIPTTNVAYCPERIFGVVVKPGERTLLKIVMDQGDTYEEVGKPAFVSVPATDVTAELAKMQKQIDDLKAQVAALLKVASPTSTPAAVKP